MVAMATLCVVCGGDGKLTTTRGADGCDAASGKAVWAKVGEGFEAGETVDGDSDFLDVGYMSDGGDVDVADDDGRGATGCKGGGGGDEGGEGDKVMAGRGLCAGRGLAQRDVLAPPRAE